MKAFQKSTALGALLLILGLGLQPLAAQDGGNKGIAQKMQTMLEENATAYISPLVTGFGEAMNSGWFHSAKPHKLLGFDLGLRAMAVGIADENMIFDFAVPDFETSITIQQNSYDITLSGEDLYPDREVPTVFGADENGEIDPAGTSQIVSLFEQQLLNQGVSQQSINESTVQNQLQTAASAVPSLVTPPGLGIDYLPMIVPQAAVGLSIPMTPIKMEVAARYLPEYEISEDIGMINFMGIGGKLALDPFLPIPFVNIAVGAYAQKLEIGDLLESNHMLYSLQLGKDLNLILLKLGVFGGVGLEKSNMKFSYTYEPDNMDDPLYGSEVNFELEGENSFRYTVGARVQLAIFNVSAAYTHSVDDIFTVGAGISIR